MTSSRPRLTVFVVAFFVLVCPAWSEGAAADAYRDGDAATLSGRIRHIRTSALVLGDTEYELDRAVRISGPDGTPLTVQHLPSGQLVRVTFRARTGGQPPVITHVQVLTE